MERDDVRSSDSIKRDAQSVNVHTDPNMKIVLEKSKSFDSNQTVRAENGLETWLQLAVQTLSPGRHLRPGLAQYTVH